MTCSAISLDPCGSRTSVQQKDFTPQGSINTTQHIQSSPRKYRNMASRNRRLSQTPFIQVRGFNVIKGQRFNNKLCKDLNTLFLMIERRSTIELLFLGTDVQVRNLLTLQQTDSLKLLHNHICFF